jgi:hypothetical protein
MPDPNDPHQPSSLDIRGKIGQTVFQRAAVKHGDGRLGPDVLLQRRRHVIPTDPRTELQLLNRARFGYAVRAWRTLAAAERSAYNRRAAAKKPPIEGLNLWIREYARSHELAEFGFALPWMVISHALPPTGPGPSR